MSVDSANDTLLHPEKLRCYCVSLPPPLLRGCLSPKVPVGVLPARTSAVLGQVLAATPQVFPAARQRGLETEADGVVSISREPGTGVFAKACSTAHHRSSHATCCRPATNSTAAAAVTTRRASRGAAFRTQSVRMQLIPRKLLISRCSLRDSTPYSSLERLETPTFTVGHGAGLQLDFSPS